MRTQDASASSRSLSAKMFIGRCASLLVEMGEFDIRTDYNRCLFFVDSDLIRTSTEVLLHRTKIQDVATFSIPA